MSKSIFEDEGDAIQLTPQERQIEENIKTIFASNVQLKDSYIQNLKTLYTTFDQLSNKINTSGDALGLSQNEQNAINSLNIIKTNLFTELSKFEKIKQESLKYIADNNPIENPNEDSIKNLQLYLNEAKFITANLTGVLNYDYKINLLKQIQGVFKEMTEPRSGLEFKEILTDNLKNIVPLDEGKKNFTKKNHNTNHELDRMLSKILEEQKELLSLLVSSQVLKIEEDKEDKKGVNETSKLFNDPTNEINNRIKDNKESKKLTAAKQKYIKLHQQEYKLRAIQESPDKYSKLS